MDIATLEEMIDRHGGDLARWPPPARAAAEALIAAAPAARALLREMREIEAALRASAIVGEAGAGDRIVARATRHAQATRARRLAWRAGLGAAAAAVLALGVLVGGLMPAPAPHDMAADHMTADHMTADRVLAAALDSGGAGDVE